MYAHQKCIILTDLIIIFFAMIIGIPKERQAGEMRVAITPKTVQRLLKKGFIIQVESEAGILAGFNDND